MAEISRFFNSVNGDRRYLAEEFANFFAKFLSSGIYSGKESQGTLEVKKEDNLKVKIDIGSALIRGYMYENTSDKVHELQAGEVYDRIDRIVLRMDRTIDNRNILSRVIKGTPGINPVPPVLIRTNEVYEISLAQVYVRKNTLEIEDSDITDERYNEEVCGFVNSIITLPTDRFEKEWGDWMQEIVKDTFAHARDETTGIIYKLGINEGIAYFEEVDFE